MRATPDLLLRRLAKTFNAFADSNYKWKDNRHRAKGIDKKDPRYPNLNEEKNDIDTDLETLKKKMGVLEQALYVRTAELRAESKGHFI
jgi:peptidoglycan hydrolase CwlO-like protein